LSQRKTPKIKSRQTVVFADPGAERVDGPRSRPMLDPAVLAEFRRRTITEAMAEVCAERQYHTASIADIAARAATSRGTVYSLYRNREDIFLDLLDRTAADVLSLVEGACASAGGEPRARVEAALRAVLGLAAEQPAIAYAFLVIAPYATPASLGRYNGVISHLAALLRIAMSGRDGSNAWHEELVIAGLADVLARKARDGQLEEAPALLTDFAGLVAPL